MLSHPCMTMAATCEDKSKRSCPVPLPILCSTLRCYSRTDPDPDPACEARVPTSSGDDKSAKPCSSCR